MNSGYNNDDGLAKNSSILNIEPYNPESIEGKIMINLAGQRQCIAPKTIHKKRQGEVPLTDEEKFIMSNF